MIKISCNNKNNYNDYYIININTIPELNINYIKDEDGVILKNKWEFSKVYNVIDKYEQYEGNKLIWSNNKFNSDEIKKYEEWRNNGFKAKTIINFPKTKWLYSYKKKTKKLSIPDARKYILLSEYEKAVKKTKIYYKLKELITNKKNILIIDKNGPKQKSIAYYMGKYGVTKDFINKGIMTINKKNISIMLTDMKHTFGVGYCLGMLLLDKEKEWCYPVKESFKIDVKNKFFGKHLFTMNLGGKTSEQYIKNKKMGTIQNDKTEKDKPRYKIISAKEFDINKELEDMITIKE